MSQVFARRGVKPEDLERYKTTLNIQDAIWNPLYDYQLYPAAGALNFAFFQVPKGQGATSAFGGAGAKTILDTNMQAPGQMPAGNKFLAEGIEVEYWPSVLPGRAGVAAAAATMGSNWNDVYSVLRNGALTFTIQNRDYCTDAPLMKFPTTTRLAGIAAYSETTATTFGQFDYAAGVGAAYSITPVLLDSNYAFTVNVTFPALIPTVSTTTGRIGVRLAGRFIRNAQ
jgi:hypothetical protein